MADHDQRWLDRQQTATALGVAPGNVGRLASDPNCPLPLGDKRGGKQVYYPLKGSESVEAARKWVLEMQGSVEEYAPLTPNRLRMLGVRQMTSARGKPDAVEAITRKLAAVKARRAAPPEPAAPVDEGLIARELAAAMRSALARCAPELGDDPKASQAMQLWVGKMACVLAGMKRTRSYAR